MRYNLEIISTVPFNTNEFYLLAKSLALYSKAFQFPLLKALEDIKFHFLTVLIIFETLFLVVPGIAEQHS